MIDTRTATGAPNDAVLASRDQIGAYRVAEFVTLARDGSPVGWPLNPDLEVDQLVFSTGYVYPGKAAKAGAGRSPVPSVRPPAKPSSDR